MKTLGTAACPPYHLAFVVGGTSAEATLKAVKLASTGYFDHLPTEGNAGGQAFRDLALEERLLKAAHRSGYGAQFGGNISPSTCGSCASPPRGLLPGGDGVSCSADRNVKAKIDRDGIWLEELDRNPGRLIPEKYRGKHEHGVVKLDLNRPMKEILAELSKHPVTTQLSLTGTLIVGRDIAHAKLKERIDRGEGLPQYVKDHPIYYAGPAKTPKGMPSGSFGPTTAGRMDSYVDLFQSHGGSLVMIAKGNRSQAVTDACRKHGGFYLGSIGGPAALLARRTSGRSRCSSTPSWDGGDLEDRGRGLPRVHPGGRQGERLLPADCLRRLTPGNPARPDEKKRGRGNPPPSFLAGRPPREITSAAAAAASRWRPSARR